jgi:ParB-like chromosome segregation protein Spo0J
VSEPTTTWEDIGRLQPHPENPNRMTDEVRAKLRRNIDRTGKYPPIVVRSLEASEAFKAEHAAGTLQIIDGEHRWRFCRESGDTRVHVDIWPGITDDQAKTLLLTMNRLQGKDDQKRRAALVRGLAELEGVESLGDLLPDSAKKIDAYLTENTAEAVAAATASADEQMKIEPVTFFMSPDQRASVDAAIKHFLAQHDPDHLIEICREGAALQGVTSAEKKKALRALALAELTREYLRREGVSDG